MMQARVSELCKTQGGTKSYISPEAYRQMIGESEWQHLYAMNQSIYAGDKESHLQFGRIGQKRSYLGEPCVYRTKKELSIVRHGEIILYKLDFILSFHPVMTPQFAL